jgi:hypothetical protein
MRAPLEQRTESLKFLIHFLGDIHQPLHVSGRGKGGNDMSVRFDGVYILGGYGYIIFIFDYVVH